MNALIILLTAGLATAAATQPPLPAAAMSAGARQAAHDLQERCRAAAVRAIGHTPSPAAWRTINSSCGVQ